MKSTAVILRALIAFCSFLVIESQAQTFKHLYSFEKRPDNPDSDLVEHSDGNFYTTVGSGLYNSGGVSKITRTGTVTLLTSLNYNSTGAGPGAGLVSGGDGNFYGVAFGGGPGKCGTVFKVTPQGLLTTLTSFNGPNGAGPRSKLVRGPDGNLYGTTSEGGLVNGFTGSTGYGTVFKVTRSGVLTTLVKFNQTNGSSPNGLVVGKDGNLYGTTASGGNSAGFGGGTVFKVTPSGTFTTIARFNYTNGSKPFGPLVSANDGNFYGITSEGGGTNGYEGGTIFKVTPGGTITTLRRFDDYYTTNTTPNFLMQGADGNLYGTIPLDFRRHSFDLEDRAGIFKMTPDGTFTMLVVFEEIFNNFNGMMQASDGNFYGVASDFLFKVTPDGALTKTTLPKTTAGFFPMTGVIQAHDGNLYGTMGYGGKWDCGTAFKVTSTGTATELASFTGTNGAYPSGLIQGSDGSFYGTAIGGATSDGTIFKMTQAGTITTLFSFNGSNGADPRVKLLQGKDGNFYGSSSGYPTGSTLFRITPGGTLTTLVTVQYTNGSYPEPLMQGRDGNFYGVMAYGGQQYGGDGTVFKMTPSGNFTKLATFHGTNGSSPRGALVEGMDGNFYGTTYSGGATNSLWGSDGTAFRITPQGILTTIYKFGGTNGTGPNGIVQGNDGYFYGTTVHQGPKYYGTIFRLSPVGKLTTLVAFNGTNGAFPYGPLSKGHDGHLYGTTVSGGARGGGTVFRLTIPQTPPSIFTQPRSQAIAADSNAWFSVHATGTRPFAIQWKKNGTNINNATNLWLTLTKVSAEDAGTYRVVISNPVGTVTSSMAYLNVILPTPPSISTQPQSKTILVGSTARFSVVAGGATPLALQWKKNGTNILNATNALLTIANAKTSDAGSYVVAISNRAGAVTSSVAKLTVVIPPPPAAPSGLTATALSSNSIVLKWINNATNVSSFEIWRRSSTNFVDSEDGSIPTVTVRRVGIVSGMARSFTNVHLLPATPYHYSVVAVNAGGRAESSVVSAKTLNVRPAAPAGLTASVLGPNHVQLSWQKQSTNVFGFTVLRSRTPQGPFAPIDYVTSGTATNTIDTTVHSGTNYSYIVRAYNDGGSSSNSAIVSVKTPMGFMDNLIWQNTNGQFSMWVMDYTNFVRYSTLPTGPAASTGWRATTFADIDLDYHSDIIWENTDGRVMVWYMTNNYVRSINTTFDSGLEGWKLAAMPDFNGDRYPDLLWHSNNGELKYWDGLYYNPYSLGYGYAASEGWTIVGTPDLDGDKSPDILWYHSNGPMDAWIMRSGELYNILSLRSGHSAGAGWRFGALVDLNRDSQMEFIWERNDGQINAWLMNGTEFIRSVTLKTNSAAGTGWKLVGPR